jgi:DNA repair photolyase
MKSKGKAIYQPAGKASEYSKWAVNFYNGCSGMCTYCYNRHGITAKVLGADKPTLKKALINEECAYVIFEKELRQNIDELRKYGLFFNFVSDPCLPETYRLNRAAIMLCLFHEVPIKILTKQTWWVQSFISEATSAGTLLNKHIWRAKRIFSIGFTLTGHDKLEKGTASNTDRITAMKSLHYLGFKTWASIEPIIDFESSLSMIINTVGHCDLYKIGLMSGKKYERDELFNFYSDVTAILINSEAKIYWKNSFLNKANLLREELPANCVASDYNLF